MNIINLNWSDFCNKCNLKNVKLSIKGDDSAAVKWLSIYMGYAGNLVVLLVQANLKKLNVHIINVETLLQVYNIVLVQYKRVTVVSHIDA